MVSILPIIVNTGKFTGRSPKDRYFVKTNLNEKVIDWGTRNNFISENTFRDLNKQMDLFLTDQNHFKFNGNVISEESHSYKVQLLTDTEWYTKFANNIFRKDNFSNYSKTIKILHAPNFIPSKFNDLKNTNFTIIHPDENKILIAGTGYAGEIKKAVFSLLNIELVSKNILPMHCSANYDEKNSTTLYFGLSGTGKTTLSSDSSKQLIGDDEHGWSSEGVFNIEGGCYAKVKGLSKDREPVIYKSTLNSETIIENVVIKNNEIDFDDTSITENTRSCYSLNTIDNIYQKSSAPHPKNIIMLSCDAFGVLPPVSKLTTEQAVYQFISGYTAKIPGTESDIKEPVATFSPCFGGPFMPRRIEEYANLFRKQLETCNSQCWLINTGWWGGPYGIGNRIDLSITRSILDNCINNSFDEKTFKKSGILDLTFPEYLDKDKKISLDPKSSWSNKDEYIKNAKKLNQLFFENFN